MGNLRQQRREDMLNAGQPNTSASRLIADIPPAADEDCYDPARM